MTGHANKKYTREPFKFDLFLATGDVWKTEIHVVNNFSIHIFYFEIRLENSFATMMSTAN